MKNKKQLTVSLAVIALLLIILQTPISVSASDRKEHGGKKNRPTPTVIPSVAPTSTPIPTVIPTSTPTSIPTTTPTVTPTIAPTVAPTAIPTLVPTAIPTAVPTVLPPVCTIVPVGTIITDQSQTIYNGGLSQTHYAGYKVWQSFTANVTGMMKELNVGFFNSMNGSATLEIFDGKGTSGTLLSTQVVNLVSNGATLGGYMLPFSLNVPVVQGNQYTFQFSNWTNLPLVIGFQIGNPGTYAGGQPATVYPNGGTILQTYDLVFNTNVESSGNICL